MHITKGEKNKKTKDPLWKAAYCLIATLSLQQAKMLERI